MALLHEEWQPWRSNPVLRLALAAIGGVFVWVGIGLWQADAGVAEWLVAIVVPFAVFAFLLFTGLRTTATTDGLVVRMVGLRTRRVAWSDVAALDTVRVRPLREFGGWGIRYGGRPRGWMYNVRGGDAVRVTFRDGKVLYVGSQDPEAALHAARQVWPGARDG
jgi:hypothetical protein